MKRSILLAYSKELSIESDEEWRLFYCDNTLGCLVVQGFDLCKLPYL